MSDRNDPDRRPISPGQPATSDPARMSAPRTEATTGAPTTGEPTTSQLRDDIDSGRTHDKVAREDPAAAPLGTDAETAGAPPTPGEVATAHRHEAGRTVSEQPTASRTATQTVRKPWPTMVWVVVAVVVVAIVLAFIF